MKQFFLICFVVLFCFPIAFPAQIPTNTLVTIVKAEDERRFDRNLENLLANPDAKVRIRAALATGRIGNESGIPALAKLLQADSSNEARAMALFALGEIESAKASGTIIEVLNNPNNPNEIRARAVEAAGKIAAANPKDEKSKELGEAILRTLDYEDKKGSSKDRNVVLLGLTAALRARPANGENWVVKFLDYSDARIRADALNTLARLRAKNANEKTRELLEKDPDAVVRANSARVLGAAEDKAALDLLLKAATADADSRVRVSAIRSLGNLKDASVAKKLLFRSSSIPQTLINVCHEMSFFKKNNRTALLECDFDLKSEMLEIATTLGRLLPNTNDQTAINFLVKFSEFDKYQSPEAEIALARIAPSKFSEFQRNKKDNLKSNWRAVSATMQGVGELAKVPDSAVITPVKEQAKTTTLQYIRKQIGANQPEDKTLSDALSAYAAFKTEDLPQVLRQSLKHRDAVVRATAAGLLADTALSKESLETLKTAFDKSLLTDSQLNDAQLAILDALFKLDKKESVPTLVVAANSKDYLVRKKAFELMRDKDLQDSDLVKTTLEKALAQKKNQLLPFSYGSKLGAILNTNADYARAVSRKSARATITTGKGAFTVEFYPEEAPLAVDNFIKLARSGYFNNVMIHRVVPNFVMQDGDPRGDGNGGPGWEIRCEINMIPYERGMVGMALSGKDTGGSQWFVTHSPQPHLDGGYTVFGRVNESDMKIVDNLVRGDKILRVKIVEGNSQQRAQRTPRRKK